MEIKKYWNLSDLPDVGLASVMPKYDGVRLKFDRHEDHNTVWTTKAGNEVLIPSWKIHILNADLKLEKIIGADGMYAEFVVLKAKNNQNSATSVCNTKNRKEQVGKREKLKWLCIAFCKQTKDGIVNLGGYSQVYRSGYKQKIYNIQKACKKLDIDIDGVVMYSKGTANALKFEQPHFETRIVKFETTVGKSGRKTLKAHCEPQVIRNRTYKVLNLYNPDKNTFKIGDKIKFSIKGNSVPVVIKD